ncbi:MAG: MFS transporter [Acidimicrobiia bacterium]|nr:MFS transporter [Acidimicrobiia bacterium]
MADPRRAREEPSSEIALEDFEDALVDGDRSVRVGTARAALAYPTFRRVYFGSLASSIGSWMQNVILGAYVYQETLSSTWVALVTLAQLGPLLLLSLVGGMIADRFERRTVLILVSVEQTAFSLLIAKLTAAEHPSMWLLLAAVLAIGIGQAIYAPSYSALIPTLVEPRDLTGAISLNSASMNLSRVIGPAIGGILFARVGAPWVFVGNAVTYGFIIIALWGVRLPRGVLEHAENRLRRLLGGVRVARDDRVVGRCLTTMVAFSLFCLPIAVLMPVLAHENLGIDGESVAYGFLYATFGSGAVVGALSIGTFLANRDLKRIVRVGLVGFAVSLAAFALDRNPAVAYPIGFVVGAFYFAVVTSLSTVLQQRLDDKVRGRVMALWIMAFGGTVPIGAMAAAPLSDAIGITAVALGGAVVAALLALWANLSEPAGAGAP